MIKAIQNNKTTAITSDLLSSYIVLEKKGDSIIIEKNGVKYSCRLLLHNTENNTVTVKVNGQKITITLKKEVDFILESFGISGNSSQSINELKAPMPGVVLDIKVDCWRCTKKRRTSYNSGGNENGKCSKRPCRLHNFFY